jgi:hexosaminidase
MVYRILLFILLISSSVHAQQIVPLPNNYKVTDGFFNLPDKLSASSSEDAFSILILPFSESVKKYTSIEINKKKRTGRIRLVRNAAITGREAYRLSILPGKITVEAGYPAGCFYGLQSLVQLFHGSVRDGKIACGVITDEPRFGWRGFMLDESRHFFGETEVKKILDLMALHKMNKFHWHLTDSPGWRIEIKQYPLLTSVGAVGNHTDPKATAGFYTQSQVAGIIRYAAERFIEVIPEIDMPGHATAAVRAYTEFSGGGSKNYPDFTFHPGKNETYGFLTNILKEVFALFPSKYIHIGGDEVSFGNQQWATFPEVQQLMKREKLADLLGVEHHFLRRMADSINKMGKTVIGWDEVATAGISRHPMIMWWRHDKPKILEAALKNGYDVILCPRIPLYFDFVQLDSHKSGRKWSGRFAPVESVYNFPSAELTGGVSLDSPQVRGIQANLWTENVHTAERMEFMTFPRLSALAEAAWTHQAIKDYPGFQKRMTGMTDIYQKSAVSYFDFMHPGTAKEVAGPEKLLK